MLRCTGILLTTILLAALAAPVAAADEEKPQSMSEAKAKDQAQTIADLAGKPVVDAKSVSQVIRMTLKDKDLFVETDLEPTDESIVRAPGLKGLSKVRIMTLIGAAANFPPPPQNGPPPIMQFSFENVDFSSPEAISIHTSVSQVPGQLMIAQDWDRLDDQTHTTQLIQSTRELGDGESRVTLYVQVTGSPAVDLRLGAENIIELRRKYPAEVSKYVDPIFRALRQEGLLARVDPRLAWQVFADEFTPPADLEVKLKQLLPKLDAQSFQEREAASAELEKLGQPAALALMKLDRKGLTDEQLSRIDGFAAKYKMVNDAEAKRLRGDRDFLLDCLYSEEEPIRRRALAELRTVTGKDIHFDVAADPELRLESIAGLRELVGATPATTQKLKS
jgi:hypothetical protein